MAILLISSYRQLKKGLKTDWQENCELLAKQEFEQIVEPVAKQSLAKQLVWTDLHQLIIFPTYNEDEE